MTSTTLDLSPSATSPTLAVSAGRNMIAAGAIFASANLFQWGVMSGALHLHPAMLSLSWPVAVAAFLIILRRLRAAGGPAAIRAAAWSRWAILGQIAIAVTLAGASALTRNWGLMMWMSPIGLAVYGLAYGVAVLRGGPKWLAGVALGALIASGGIALLVGTPAQYLAYASGLVAFTLIPGVALALSRTR